MAKTCQEPGCRWNLGHHGGIHQDIVNVAERITLAATPVEQCTRVLHIDWEADNPQGFVREDVARCALSKGHSGVHRSADDKWRW